MPYIRALFGIVVLLGIAFLFSEKRKNINWKQVVIGVLLQLFLGLLILKVPFVYAILKFIGDRFVDLTAVAMVGAEFVFGDLTKNSFDPTSGANHQMGFILAFQVLPLILFFATLTSLLYYLGILQYIVKGFALFFSKTLGISGPESLSAAGNIFIGQAEAPLLVKPYLKDMRRSEIMCIMSIGMCTIAGSVMAAYVNMLGGGNAEKMSLAATQLLAASIMNVPAGIILSKILVPYEEDLNINRSISTKVNRKEIGVNVIDALARGAGEGIKLAVNVGGMLLAFVAMIALVNFILGEWIGDPLGINNLILESTNGQFTSLSFEYLFGQVFRLIAFAIGIDWNESLLVGSLLGQKTVINEFIAYDSLSRMKAEGLLSQKAVYMSTFALCGFSNFSSIAIQIGGIGLLAPNQKENLSKLGLKALLAGALACLMSATMVGVMF